MGRIKSIQGMTMATVTRLDMYAAAFIASGKAPSKFTGKKLYMWAYGKAQEILLSY